MNKKYILIILIVIVVLLIVGCIGYVSIFNKGTEVTVGDLTFQCPNGYSQGIVDGDFNANLTNGTHSIYISEYAGNDVLSYINEYVDDRNNVNQSIDLSNYTLGNIVIYKSYNNGTGANHYWFIHGNNTYSIYSWGPVPNMDSITNKLIVSAFD